MEAVRVAVPDDQLHFTDLANRLIASVAAQRGGQLLMPGPGTAPLDLLGVASFADLLDDVRRLILVGTIDDVVAGAAACRVQPLGESRFLGVFDGCYVEPEARGIGLGHLLSLTATQWLEAQGCVGVDGVALPGDRVAKTFYEASGFKARLLVMHRAFD